MIGFAVVEMEDESVWGMKGNIGHGCMFREDEIECCSCKLRAVQESKECQQEHGF